MSRVFGFFRDLALGISRENRDPKIPSRIQPWLRTLLGVSEDYEKSVAFEGKPTAAIFSKLKHAAFEIPHLQIKISGREIRSPQFPLDL